MWKGIADWESLYIEYMDAGGAAMDYEDRRGQLLRILPRDLRRDLFRRINDFHSIASLKEWIREQLELERQWNDTDHPGARAKSAGMIQACHPDGEEQSDEEAGEYDMEA